MTTYLDTSLLVSALTPEASSKRVHRWLEAQAAGSLVISDWTITEFASALAIKVRSGALEIDDRARTQAAWTTFRRDSLTTLPTTSVDFALAAAFIDRSPGLRAGDALHLAVAAAHGCTIATLDELQRRCARVCGVPTVRI